MKLIKICFTWNIDDCFDLFNLNTISSTLMSYTQIHLFEDVIISESLNGLRLNRHCYP